MWAPQGEKSNRAPGHYINMLWHVQSPYVKTLIKNLTPLLTIQATMPVKVILHFRLWRYYLVTTANILVKIHRDLLRARIGNRVKLQVSTQVCGLRFLTSRSEFHEWNKELEIKDQNFYKLAKRNHCQTLRQSPCSHQGVCQNQIFVQNYQAKWSQSHREQSDS